jgi:AcrR family transcriptional regulator
MRKQAIVKSATYLFGELGYEKATTLMIAKEGKVSEALIFKHFKSKVGLLQHIVKTGYTNIILTNKGMLSEKAPLTFIYNVLDLPAKLVKDNSDFWKMQARMMDIRICKEAHEHFMQPVHKLLLEAFKNLGYKEGVLETKFLMLIIDIIWKNHAKDPNFESKELTDFIKSKYTLQKIN